MKWIPHNMNFHKLDSSLIFMMPADATAQIAFKRWNEPFDRSCSKFTCGFSAIRNILWVFNVSFPYSLHYSEA